MINFTFPRALRLLTPYHFAFIFQQPQRVGTYYITILGRLNKLGYPRVGLIVAKKYVKQAHERNRIKRLMRESFRLHQHYLPAMDFAIITKKGAVYLNNNALMEEFKKIWRRYRY